MTESGPEIAPLDDYRALVISGPDRVAFLQGQLTQDVAALAEAGSLLAGWATAKGRLLAFGQLLAVGDEIWWPLRADIVDGIARRLGMFKLRADVQITVGSQPVSGLVGLADLASIDIAGETITLDARPQRLADDSVIARVTGDPDRAWLIGPAVSKTGLASSPDSAWTLASIRAGLPTIIAATQEQFVPQMLNLDQLGAISFDKGCYIGQEIVARTQNLGRIKRRMYRFSADAQAKLSAGDSIHGPGDATGKVVLSERDGDTLELLAVVAIDQAGGDWFADSERTNRLANTDPSAG